LKEQGFSILYVDDEQSNLSSFHNLYGRDFVIYTAISGLEGLKLLEVNSIQLIITDQRMPEMSGLEFIETAQKKFPNSLFVLLIGYADHNVLKKAINHLEIYRYISKPFDHMEMRSLITNSLERFKLLKDRDRLALELILSEKKLNGIVEKSADAIFLVDGDEKILMVNKSTEVMFGCSKPQLLKQHLSMFIKSEAVNSSEVIVHNLLDVPMIENRLSYGLSSQGKKIPIEMSVSSFFVGEKRYFNAVVRDLTIQVASLNKLRESRERFENLFEYSPDAIFIHRKGQVTNVNQSFLKLFNYKDKEEVLKHDALELLVLKDDYHLLKTATKGIESEQVHFVNEVRFLKKRGVIFYGDTHVSSIATAGKIETQVVLRDVTERKATEKIIMLQAERLKLATSSTNIGIYDWLIKENVLIWDDAMYNIYGVNKTDGVEAYETWSSSLHPEDKEYAENQIKLALSGEKEYNVEFRVVWPDGSIRYIHGEGTVVIDEQGKAIRLTGTNVDITLQRRSQETLSAVANIQNTFIAEDSSQKSFSQMIKSLLEITQSEQGFIGEVRTNEKGRYFKIHAVMELYKGGENLTSNDVQVTEDFKEVQMKVFIKTIISTGEPLFLNDLCIKSLTDAGGDIGSTSNCFLGLPFFKNNELIGIIGAMKKKGEYTEACIEALAPFLSTCGTLVNAYHNNRRRLDAEKEVAKFADIVSHSSDAIISTDQHGDIVSWNFGAEKLFGYNSAEMMGCSFETLVPASLLEKHQNIFQQVCEGKFVESYDTKQVKKDEEVFHVNMSIFALKDRKGKIKGVSSISRDISEQKEAQKIKEEFTKQLESKVKDRTLKLEQAQVKLAMSLEKEKELSQFKSRFVASASHQFRTPLTVIQSSMGLLAMQKNEMGAEFTVKFDKVFTRVKGQINRMTSLMNDVLVLGGVNAGSVVPKFASTDLVSICQEVVSSYNEIQVDGRAIEVDVKGDPTKLDLDSKLITNAISNLVSNAFKYSEGKKSPGFAISYEKDNVFILITNEGVGFSEKDLPHIFEPFYRASNVSGIPGTGLGTSISKEYIELNGGMITAVSSPNKKTEFSIIFKK
jgi:PAS domain S-box-containing protein